MSKVKFDISMSLDGFIAGPNQTREQPLGEGGEQLHEWGVGLASFRERHGEAGGETGPDDEILRESFETTEAVLMGRRMFSGGAGPWEDDPNADGWWGDDPPFRLPVFALTHHPRDTVTKEGGTSFTFVTDGIEAALEQAREAAGNADIAIAGGASVIQQYLAAGVIDEFQIHIAPVLLGDGVRLFDGIEKQPVELVRVIDSPRATHLKYRLRRA